MKRFFDMLVAGAILVMLSPLMVAIWVAVRLTSRGPGIYRQTRIGLHGQPFTIYKFRTMRVDADDREQREFNRRELTGELDEQETYTLADDDRITPIGGPLRKLSLDELPQFYNVLIGDMSLVGPRPSLEWEAELFEPRFQRRTDVRPGITGLWQVSGRRSIDMRGMLELDVEYVDNQSFVLDLKLLSRTPKAVLEAQGAA